MAKCFLPTNYVKINFHDTNNVHFGTGRVMKGVTAVLPFLIVNFRTYPNP